MEEEKKLIDNQVSIRDTLHVEVFNEFDKVPPWPTSMTTMVSLEALTESNDSKRAPVTICAVIDRSGSMQPHLPLMKETLNFMVQQMRPDDNLCLIAFDHDVSHVLPLMHMNDAGKLKAEKAIEALKARGHTNLSGGLLAALQTLYRIPKEEATTVESVLLFTDGIANYGIAKREPLEKATRSVLAQIGRRVSVFTLGFGPDHDSDFLRGLADAGNGLFYYLDNEDSIPESFCDCLGGLMSVAAQNVLVTLESDGVCVMDKPVTSFQVQEEKKGHKYVITIPDIYCEEEKCILLKVSIPRLPEKEESSFRQVNMFSASVEYFDAINSCVKENIAAAFVTQTSQCREALPAANRQRLLLQQFRVQVASCMEQAAKMADQGRYKDARELLSILHGQIVRSEVRKDDLAVYFAQTLTDCLGNMADRDTYTAKGKATLASHAHSHWQQRSNCTTEGIRDFYYEGVEDYEARKEARKVHLSPTVPVSPRSSASTGHTVMGMKQIKKSAPYRNKAKSHLMEAYVSPSVPALSIDSAKSKVQFNDRVSVMEASMKPKAKSDSSH